MNTTEFYASSNGDKWYLVYDREAGRLFVRHMPNVPSGGKPSEYHLAAFLSRNEHSPEHQGLVQLLASAVEKHGHSAFA